MKKVCIVSSLFGAYDTNLEIFGLKNTSDEYFDFHLYTNQTRLTSDIWNIHYVSEEDFPVKGDVPKSSYYYKWNHHNLKELNPYDISVWIDASAWNIQLDNIKTWAEAFSTTGKFLSIQIHPTRSLSLREELEANCGLNKDDVKTMVDQVNGYYNCGYKDGEANPVPETGLSFRVIRDSRTIKLCDELWSELACKNKTKRDQLVYSYALWKTGSGEGVQYFTLNHKMEKMVCFKDHPNRSVHVEKVLLVGPWIGDSHIEPYWVNHVKAYLNRTPIDTVIVGCRADSAKLYDVIAPNKIIPIEKQGKTYKHLFDGKIPKFDVKVGGNKEVLILSPSEEIMTAIYRPNIHILWCTIRPSMMVDTYKYWMDNASKSDKIHLHVGVDTEQQKNELIGLGIPSYRIAVCPPNPSGKRGVTWPSYCLSSNLECNHGDDIVIFASDDFYPMKDWDSAVIRELSDFNGCLVVNDKLNANQHTIVAIPIMTYDCLVQHGKVIYHPAYGHAFSDQELYDDMVEMKMMKDIASIKPEVFFEHRHWTSHNPNRSKDDSDTYQGNKHYEERYMYERRKKFTLADRIVVDMPSKKLSILVCSLVDRREAFAKLRSKLETQIAKYNGAVELVVNEDNGQKSIGKKRNELLHMANGQYICFIDDDDDVSDWYIDKMIEGIAGGVDCCSLIGTLSVDGIPKGKFAHSLRYKKWDEKRMPDGSMVYYRCPNHLNVVERSIAKKVGFQDISFGEDKIYSDGLLKYLSSEIEVEGINYHYISKSSKYTKKLSILMLNGGSSESLVGKVKQSVSDCGPNIEVLVDDNVITDGTSITKLLSRSSGEYIILVDSDGISTESILSIMEYLKNNPDAKGYKISKNPNRIHMNVIRRRIAVSIGFGVGDDYIEQFKNGLLSVGVYYIS